MARGPRWYSAGAMTAGPRNFTPDDPKHRLISLFVGAVLLPSLALSYVAFDFVQKLAKERQKSEIKRAENILYWVEKELKGTAQARARDAGRVVGSERLVDGRKEVIQAALREAGMQDDIFESLHLEGPASRLIVKHKVEKAGAGSGDLSRDLLLNALQTLDGTDDEDSVDWTADDGRTVGKLRFKFACGYIHGQLIREYFESEFKNPDQSLVVRVAEPDGTVIYENAATPGGTFEVKREMEGPSFKGLKLFLRYRDSSIEQDVNRWKTWTLCLIGFIDLMLGAGLYLIYSNVRRELHLSRLKSDFVANVSHELKTPLALIRLFAETLEMGRVPGEEKSQQYYRVINKESQRLTQLINNILDFSRIEAGRREYRLAPAEVSRIVAEVVEAYRFQIEQQGFTFEVEVEPGLPRVVADKEALAQALLNLVNNALKYTRDEKYLKLRVARRGDDQVAVSVTDRGIGVAKGEQKKIFEKFYRAEDSLVHETKGSGLGLSLVQHIMEAHGGSVEVESAPGKGSTFTLVLPFESEGRMPRPVTGPAEAPVTS
jgi:signal transduction histidine kinase